MASSMRAVRMCVCVCVCVCVCFVWRQACAQCHCLSLSLYGIKHAPPLLSLALSLRHSPVRHVRVCFNGRHFLALVVGLLCFYIRGSFADVIGLFCCYFRAHEKKRKTSKRTLLDTESVPAQWRCDLCLLWLEDKTARRDRGQAVQERGAGVSAALSPAAFVSVIRWHCRSSTFRVLFKQIY